MRFFSWITAALLAVSTFSVTNAKCSQPRVRRAMTDLSPAEVMLYKDALAMAMDSGAVAVFGEIHYEMMSEQEAHGQCMFIYWHRYFIAAFENVLRAQDPRFECVTLPYWDWMSDYDRFASGQCADVVECSPMLQIMGGRGPKTAERKNYTINGYVHEGFCATEYPMDHFCQSTQVSGEDCIRCVPRDDWTGTPIPAIASYASVRAQVFNGSTIGEMSKAIEEGAHNNMHGILGSMFGTEFTHQAPGDPIFWSHHAMIDMLHAIFHKCRVGEQKLTFAQKATSVNWASCGRRNNGTTYLPTDRVMARTGYMGQNPVNATLHPLVGKFFSILPQEYAALMDIRDLGESSYTYAIHGLAGKLFTHCGMDGEGDLDLDVHAPKEDPNAPKADTNSPVPNAPVPNSPVQNSPVQKAVKPVAASLLPPMSQLINRELEPSTVRMEEWVRTMDALVASRDGDKIVEAEKMACLFQDECLGGVSSYTDELKKYFRITTEPRCRQIVEEVHATNDAVAVADWKAQMVKSFGCPKPKEEETRSIVHPASFRK